MWSEPSIDSSRRRASSVRRNIAMLRVIRRTVLGRGPSRFRELFKLALFDGHPAWTGSQCSRHPFQLENPRGQHHSHMLARSALGLARVYSHLPPKVVGQPSVSSFQTELQRLVKDRATARCVDWAQSLSLRTCFQPPFARLLVTGHVIIGHGCLSPRNLRDLPRLRRSARAVSRRATFHFSAVR